MEHINIKSEEKVGSTFTVVLDQKIKLERPLYSKYIFNKKKVIVVSNSLETLKEINTLSNKYDIDLLATMYSNDLIQRVLDGEEFDIIILEDEMTPLSGYTVLRKLQEVKKNYNIPTVVMLKKDKESIKDHYIEDGFNGYIRKQNLEEDFDKIIKKYI